MTDRQLADCLESLEMTGVRIAFLRKTKVIPQLLASELNARSAMNKKVAKEFHARGIEQFNVGGKPFYVTASEI